MIFSSKDQNCIIPEENEVCEVCEEITEITEPEQCTEDIVECSFFSILVYYPVPYNCSQYASCSFGLTTIKDCAENKYFDVDAKLCVEESSCVACKQ